MTMPKMAEFKVMPTFGVVLPPSLKAKNEVSTSELTEDEATYILNATLKPKHREDQSVLRFIESYIRCRNVSQAARDAGLKSSQGQSLRMRPDIHLAITKITDKSVMKFGFDAAEVIERVKEIIQVDPIELENPDGSFKTHLSQLSPELRRAIRKFKVKNLWDTDVNGMKVVTGQIVEVEMWDKLKSVELLGREKDLFKTTSVVKHDVTTNMKDFLLESSNRAEKHKQNHIAANPIIDVTPTKENGE